MDPSVFAQRFAVVDTETTGLDPQDCRMLQLGIVIARGDGTIESEFATYVRQNIPGFGKLGAYEIHGITRRDLRDGLPVGVISRSHFHGEPEDGCGRAEDGECNEDECGFHRRDSLLMKLLVRRLRPSSADRVSLPLLVVSSAAGPRA